MLREDSPDATCMSKPYAPRIYTRDVYLCLEPEAENNCCFAFLVRKDDKEIGQTLAYRARASATQHQWLSILAATPLRTKEHAAEEAWCHLIPFEARNHGWRKLLCADSIYFFVYAVIRNGWSLEDPQLCHFVSIKRSTFAEQTSYQAYSCFLC